MTGGRLRGLLRALLLVGATWYALCAFALLYVRIAQPPVTAVQLQRRAEAIVRGQSRRADRIWVDLDRLPPHVWRAVVAAEDTRFFEHWGFDVIEIRDAREEAARGERRRGASTITQQLVKNLFLTTHANPIRKALELMLTPVAELVLSKQRILELYVNNIEWGPGIWGIEAAARHHYGVRAGQLSREQAARLAAVIPAPLRRRPQNVGWYAEIILERMEAMGW